MKTHTWPWLLLVALGATLLLACTPQPVYAEIITGALPLKVTDIGLAQTVQANEPTPPLPVLHLTKAVDNSAPGPGDVVTYTIVVSNTGAAQATGAVISDTLPTGVIYAGSSIVEPPGTIMLPQPSLVHIQLPTLDASARVTVALPLSITASAPTDVPLTNTAWITSAEVTQPITGSATMTVTSGPPPVQMVKLMAADGARDDNFGYRVALDGDTALIGILGGESRVGAAYIFSRKNGIWTQQTKLTAADGMNYDHFGASVALDGDTALIGAFGDENRQGAAYVFTRSGDTWTQQAKLAASDGAASDRFGVAVALDGDLALIGADSDESLQGAAYVFSRSGSTWAQQAKLTAADGVAGDYFGGAVTLDGDTALIGAAVHKSVQGAAYVFTRSGDTWVQQAKLTANDGMPGEVFGGSMALDGDQALIGAAGDKEGGNEAGATYIFSRSNGTWTQQAKLLATDSAADDNFGVSVALDGKRALIGAYGAENFQGAVYIFGRTGTTWTQQSKLTAADGDAGDYFGGAVALDGETALIGAWGDDEKIPNAGAAYIWQEGGVVLPPALYLSKTVGPSTPAPGDVVTYTLVVSNTGAGAATGVLISDTLPAGMTYAGSGSVDPSGVILLPRPTLVHVQLPSLAAGARATITLPVTVSSGTDGQTLMNTAWITSEQLSTPGIATATLSIISLMPTTPTPPTLAFADAPITVDFPEPVITSTIAFTFSPPLMFTPTWQMEVRALGDTALASRAIVYHAPFSKDVPYTLSLLPGGKTAGEHDIPGGVIEIFTYSSRFKVYLPVVIRE